MTNDDDTDTGSTYLSKVDRYPYVLLIGVGNLPIGIPTYLEPFISSYIPGGCNLQHQ